MQIKSKRYYTMKRKSRITKFSFIFMKKMNLKFNHVHIFDLHLIRNDQIISTIYSIYENKYNFFCLRSFFE